MMRSRYAMNPLLRQFALLLLDQQKDEKQALQASYGEYFLSYLHQKAAQLNLKDPDRTCLNDIDKELTHLNLALDWAMLTGQRQLAIQGARDLERFRQAYQVVLLNNSTKIANLPEFDNVDLDSEHLRMVEQSGFCCDRQRHLSDANNAILIAAESGQITAANFQAQQLSGYALEALLEKNIDELGLNSHDIDWVDSPQIETHLIHRSGASVAVDALRSSSRQAQTFSYMFILRKRENYNKQENTVILEDPLTHLPNRQAFIDQLRKSISQAANRAQQVGVLIIDIHGYKSILEQMGLENSQFLLKRVAERLQESLRQADFLARLGADEFGLILENLPQSKVVQVVAGKLLAQFEQPFNVGEKPLQLSVSIGTGLYPLDGDHAEALMRFADQASKKSE
jgi:diguanylate cyclase (GGDEF)-like protein